MKIISLNCWGAHEYEAVMDFLRQHKDSTDIFCLQEVFSTSSDKEDYKESRLNFLEELQILLPDYLSEYTSMLDNSYFEHEHVEFDLKFGLAIFYRKDLAVKLVTKKKILDWTLEKEGMKNFEFTAQLQIIDLLVNNKQLSVVNFHGVPFPGSKVDTDERLLQSKTILEVLSEKKGEFIVLGDFNLLPETNSIGMLEAKLRNLISEYSIPTTRSELNGWRGKEGEQKHADYTFVTEGIQVKSFEVPDINISDHLPMLLEFEV